MDRVRHAGLVDVGSVSSKYEKHFNPLGGLNTQLKACLFSLGRFETSRPYYSPLR